MGSEQGGSPFYHFTVEGRRIGACWLAWKDSGIVRETLPPPIGNPWRDLWDRQACHAQRCARVYGRLEPHGA